MTPLTFYIFIILFTLPKEATCRAWPLKYRLV